MRRLQSFKSPSRLSEKLKFSNKVTSSSSSSNTVRFIPNLKTSESSEFIQNIGKSEQSSVDVNKREYEDIPKNVENLDFETAKYKHVSLNRSSSHITNSINIKEDEIVHSSDKIVKFANLTVPSPNSDKETSNSVLENDLSIGRNTWSILQMPKYIPSSQNEANNTYNTTELNFPSIIQDIPSGSIGKLLFRKNGRMNLILNGGTEFDYISLKVDDTMADNSEQFIMALIKSNELMNLGTCSSTLVVTPDLLKTNY